MLSKTCLLNNEQTRKQHVAVE